VSRPGAGIAALALVGALAPAGWAAGLGCAPPAIAHCLIGTAQDARQDLTRTRDRDEAGFAIATALGTLGRFDEALAQAADIAEPATAAEAVGEIALAIAQTGDIERARELALGIDDARSRSARILALEAIAAEQARRGDAEGAYETVVAIANPYRRSEAQAAIALSVARTGDISGAVRAASRIATDYWFTADQDSRKIPSGLVVRSKDFDQFWFYEALVGIAEIEAVGGDVESALQTAHAIPDVAARSRALGRIAAVQAGLGDLEGARLTAQLIEGAYGDAEALIAMADALAERGRMAEAIDLARQIQSAYGNAAALVAVAGRIAETGDIAQAEALAAEIGAIEYLTQARIALARAEARRGQIATALSLVAAVPHRGERAAAVADICASLAVAGDGAGARALARGFASGPALDELILATARAEARAGKDDAALATAEEIEDTLLRAVAAAELARIIGP
jgi:hypothetical protein